MRKVHCADCGKNYDYDVDDFCPRCGSFNPPPDSGATRLEQELLSRFQRPGADGRPRQSTHPTYGGSPDLKRGQSHAPRVNGCAACGPEKQKKKGGCLGVLIILLVVLAALFVLSPLVERGIRQGVDALSDLTGAFSSREEEVHTPAQPVREEISYADDWYTSYDTFSLSNGQQLSVGGGWEPWLPQDYLEQYPAGTRCVAVGLWVLGQGDGGDIPLTLTTEDGASYQPQPLPQQLAEETGLDNISLADGLPQEELYGYCFYFLPEEAVGQALTMVIMDQQDIHVRVEMDWED